MMGTDWLSLDVESVKKVRDWQLTHDGNRLVITGCRECEESKRLVVNDMMGTDWLSLDVESVKKVRDWQLTHDGNRLVITGCRECEEGKRLVVNA